MIPTQKNVTESEYENDCSSDTCPKCHNLFYIMACGWDVSIAVDCPYCDALVKQPWHTRNLQRKIDNIRKEVKS